MPTSRSLMTSSNITSWPVALLITKLEQLFIQNLEPATLFWRFGKKIEHQGFKSVTFPRMNIMKRTLTDVLIPSAQEGVTPAGTSNTAVGLEVTPIQLIDYFVITDVLSSISLLNFFNANMTEMFNNALRIIDQYVQTFLNDGSVVHTLRPTGRATINDIVAADTMNLLLHNTALNVLMTNGVYDGATIAIMSTNVYQDLRTNTPTTSWLYRAVTELPFGKQGYQGTIAGTNCDIYVTSNIEALVNTGSVEVYSSFYFYPDYSYGCTTLSWPAGGNLHTFVRPRGTTGGDIAFQRMYGGYKAAIGCGVLRPLSIVRVLTAATTNFAWNEQVV